MKNNRVLLILLFSAQAVQMAEHGAIAGVSDRRRGR